MSWPVRRLIVPFKQFNSHRSVEIRRGEGKFPLRFRQRQERLYSPVRFAGARMVHQGSPFFRVRNRGGLTSRPGLSRADNAEGPAIRWKRKRCGKRHLCSPRKSKPPGKQKRRRVGLWFRHYALEHGLSMAELTRQILRDFMAGPANDTAAAVLFGGLLNEPRPRDPTRRLPYARMSPRG
jgi:hypothetical protein